MSAPSPAARVVLALVGAYRVLLSPLVGGACRYSPSCSEYMSQAVVRHGALRGGWLGLRRLARCHPLGGHGWDPVPEGRLRAQGSGLRDGSRLTAHGSRLKDGSGLKAQGSRSAQGSRLRVGSGHKAQGRLTAHGSRLQAQGLLAVGASVASVGAERGAAGGSRPVD